MASRPNEPGGRPEPGQILIVIHDFSARSSDELSLSKGDRVELIERDDDFGDGWYLGRHLMNGNSGLFPEVYTRLAPRGPPSYPPAASTTPRSHPTTFDPPNGQPLQAPIASSIENTPPSVNATPSAIIFEATGTPEASHHTSAAESLDEPLLTSPLTTSILSQDSESHHLSIATPPEIPMQPKSLTTAVKAAHIHGQDSPVMNETLSVIDEHITDMNSPHHSIVASDRRGGNDSGSEYSSHLDQRMSYINGEETDEEEEQLQTREEVETWSPDQVAEYLFTSGVEKKHCEVFRDQEITGDVLLGMDQTSVFLKEFDLGSVGRRLKTWQKIRALQDEVNGETSTRRNTVTYGSDVGSDQSVRHRSRSTNSSSMLPRIPSMNERPGSLQNSRLSQQQTLRNDSAQASPVSPVSPKTLHDASRPVGDKRRPSAASIRDLHHSRQSSVNEYTTASLMGTVARDPLSIATNSQDTPHKKQPSFDKNWTMGAAASPSLPTRPVSSSGLKDAGSSTDQLSQTTIAPTAPDSLDRGYFSGGEVEGKQRNVLRKRGSTATHSRNSSYTDEQRLRSATAHSRHSRFGSVDSMRDSAPPTSAAQKYYGLSVNGRRRTPSENSINAPPRPLPPPKDAPSPTVTKLGGEHGLVPKSPNTSIGKGSDWLLPVKPVSSRAFGLRAISDAVTGTEKSRIASPTESVLASPVKDSPIQSPSRAESSTPSAGPSFELDSPDAKSASTMMTVPGSAKSNKKKSKKETSAYTRGLEKKSPQEQMIGADYSGWMKKKSTNMLATWKPRLFVLKGRRLSYYYSENDDQEKGLIDISFHRVLPADNDRLTGLHATITGAQNSPTSPSGAHIATIAAQEVAAEPESTLSKGSSDQMFIFKLVPPRTGLPKGVSFTKPTIHYFAVPNIKQGRLWMAALMKATIDRDDSKPITTTYQQKTISLAKARAMRHRPPALMNLDEHVDEEAMKTPASDKAGLNIRGIIFDREPQEGDSGFSGVSKPEAQTSESTLNGSGTHSNPEPRTA